MDDIKAPEVALEPVNEGLVTTSQLAQEIIANEKALALETSKSERNKAAREALYKDMDEIETLLATGDVGKIATNTQLRKAFIITRCVRLGIPIHPEAIIFIPSDGKLKVYHTAVCASLIRNARGWSSQRIEAGVVDGTYDVWMRVFDPKNPTHFSENLGSTPMVDGEGNPLSSVAERTKNKKQAVTQAERRSTLSLAGLAGEDPREDGAMQTYYPQDGGEAKELKVVTPTPRTAMAPASPALPSGGVLDLPASPTAAPIRRIVKRKDGSIVPQKGAPGGPALTVAPQPQVQGAKAAPPAELVLEPSPDVAQAAPVAPGKPPRARKGSKGTKEPAVAPVAQEAPPAAPCDHSVLDLASLKPGTTYACPLPEEGGCGEEFTTPGEKPKPPAGVTTTTAPPVRPKLTIRRTVVKRP